MWGRTILTAPEILTEAAPAPHPGVRAGGKREHTSPPPPPTPSDRSIDRGAVERSAPAAWACPKLPRRRLGRPRKWGGQDPSSPGPHPCVRVELEQGLDGGDATEVPTCKAKGALSLLNPVPALPGPRGTTGVIAAAVTQLTRAAHRTTPEPELHTGVKIYLTYSLAQPAQLLK